jgi:hypothetical protein
MTNERGAVQLATSFLRTVGIEDATHTKSLPSMAAIFETQLLEY